jgi:hypothetical protein
MRLLKGVAATAGIFGLGFLLYYLICLGSYQSYAESQFQLQTEHR